ncbi:MAG: diguanylate cyclase [Rhodobacteraceae bacterium PARR1]|nr:MAG: diguanylate cyclase [Rhodobacteraceae bacterium PARR1]
MDWGRHKRMVAGAVLAGASLFAGVVGLGLPLQLLLLALPPLVWLGLQAALAAEPDTPPALLPPGLACRAMDAVFEDANAPDPACLILLTDDRMTLDTARIAATLLPVLRTTDMLSPVEGGLAVTLAPLGRLDLEAMIPIAVRLQRAALTMGPVAVGFCLPDLAPARSGQAMLHCARLAAEEARRHGPGAIRSFRPGMVRDHIPPPRVVLEAAFDAGQFIAHFQPQICARTGSLTGAEVLARWHHPEAGLLSPTAFLGDLRHAGLSSRLTMAMLSQSMAQLRHWDSQGLTVPTVAINLDAQDLADPMLPDHIAWEMDRHDLPPHRLTVEVMETVLADGDPVTVRGIDRLARMGCGVDLDDFGTGQAAIGQLRRLTIRRIKIDRSFTAGVDSDADQRRVVMAILSMADRLGLDTLAEGVESAPQAEVLSTMGCGHLQGWAIGHPMPGALFAAWLATHSGDAAQAAARSGADSTQTPAILATASAAPVTPV